MYVVQVQVFERYLVEMIYINLLVVSLSTMIKLVHIIVAIVNRKTMVWKAGEDQKNIFLLGS